jgi:cell division protein FtsB
MPSTTTPNGVPTDEQVVDTLTKTLDAATKELAELDARRDTLAARVKSLSDTVAVFKGETLAPKRRASKRRASKRAAAEAAPVADAAA